MKELITSIAGICVRGIAKLFTLEFPSPRTQEDWFNQQILKLYHCVTLLCLIFWDFIFFFFFLLLSELERVDKETRHSIGRRLILTSKDQIVEVPHCSVFTDYDFNHLLLDSIAWRVHFLFVSFIRIENDILSDISLKLVLVLDNNQVTYQFCHRRSSEVLVITSFDAQLCFFYWRHLDLRSIEPGVIKGNSSLVQWIKINES